MYNLKTNLIVMAKVQTNKSFEFGKERATSFETLKFDEKGQSQEIDQEIAEALTTASPSLSIVGAAKEVVKDDLDSTQKVAPTVIVEKNGDQIKQEDLDSDLDQGSDIDLTTAPGSEVQGNVDVIEGDIVEGDQIKEGSEGIDDAIINQGDDSQGDKLTKEQLMDLNMGEIREALTSVGVTVEELAQFKGKEAKEALVDFAITKL